MTSLITSLQHTRHGGFRLLALINLFLCAVPLSADEPSIEFKGVSGELESNLRAGLSLTAESCDAPAWRVNRLFRRADSELDQAARALGYYRIQLEKKILFNPACWQASFDIQPGEPAHLVNVDIVIQGEAQGDASFGKLLKASPVKKGSQVHHGQYEALKGEIERVAAERGYFDGRFVRTELKVDPQKNQASITLHYDSGKRYRIGNMVVDQQTYDPELLERYIKIRAGDPYDSTALANTHRGLADSGYFQSVSVKPDFKGAQNGTIDVQVVLEPIKRLAYRIGIGAATDTGPRLSLGYERRRLNRLGHRLESKLVLSQVDSSIGLEYLIPVQQPHIDQISFRTGYRHLDTDSTISDTATIGVRAVGNRNGWSETRYLDWISEESQIGTETTQATLLVPGISWAKTKADNRMLPRKGYRLSLELKGAEEALLSDVRFFQLQAAAKWIYPLGAGRLLIRGDTGLTLTEDFEKLPASYRFFAGGDQSVRGYGYQALGPKNTDGTVVGGRYLLSGSVEYEYPIKDDWSAALFIDAGNAVDGWNEELKRSAGVGLRWRSPVGPIRLDLAIPEDTSEDSFRIHFSMGADL
ncbi:MAG: autotransporter assembly complex protein TamA [Sedimenticola sp.]|nr:autotransporter assembly complex protein TamA [Sedimenticola sp.]MCW8974149.1 autotransporter assembly complex protein TamA [Sedimenticola sp.]